MRRTSSVRIPWVLRHRPPCRAARHWAQASIAHSGCARLGARSGGGGQSTRFFFGCRLAAHRCHGLTCTASDARLSPRGPSQSTGLSCFIGTKSLQIRLAVLVFFDQYKGTEEYSLAHELGHDVLHIDHGCLNTLLLPDAQEQSVTLCCMNSNEERDRNAKRREFQAERFAASILMPQDLLRAACAMVDIYQWTSMLSQKKLEQIEKRSPVIDSAF